MNLSSDDVIPYPVITSNPALSLFILSYYPSYNQDFFRTLKSPHPFELILWWRHSLSRAIRPIPALSLFILSNHPSYNQDLFRTLKSPHPFEFIVWWRHSLSRAITPNPALSLFILSYHPSYNQDFFRTLKSPHPFEFILWWRHSLSRENHAKSCLITFYHPSITKLKLPILSPQQSKRSFQNSKITPPLWIYPLMTSFLIPCYHANSCLITFYP